jgi:hypothetical protein
MQRRVASGSRAFGDADGAGGAAADGRAGEEPSQAEDDQATGGDIHDA